MRLTCSFILLIFLSIPNFSLSNNNLQKKTVTLSGYITDSSNGESLIGASVYLPDLLQGATANSYGFYSLSVEPGEYTIRIGFVGFKTEVKTISILNNQKLDFELTHEMHQLNEFEIVGDKQGLDLQRPEMGVVAMPMITIKRLPAMMGEVDLIKAIQLLPGVQATSEGSSSFSVRGGSGDQNLVLLDEATVYNASHLMGFFSVFNNDAINSVKLYKGDIPVWSGGRLASLLDVRMKEGNRKRFGGSGGIGLLSSRLTLEGPIIKDKSSFIVSGRRSYYDIFTSLSSDEDIKNTTLYFYDLNGKVNFSLGDNDRLYFSVYQGRDVMDADFAGMEFGNRTITGRWNHLFSQRIFSNLSLIYSKYDYELGFQSSETNEYRMKYDMNEAGLKYDFKFLLSPDLELNAGAQWMFHTLNPGTSWATGNSIRPYVMSAKKSADGAAYLQAEQKIGDKIVLRYGLRWSLFANRGVDTVHVYNDKYEEVRTDTYSKGDYFNWQNGLEPRFGISWLLNEQSSLKASYARAQQYFQVATNSTSGTPLDMWFTSSPNVKPQISDQWSVGYNRFLNDEKIELTAELYYKQMHNTIDFKDHPDIMFNKKMEGEIRFGKSYAYGIELMAALNLQKLSGWASYAYTQSERKIDEVANEKWFKSPFEKPHAINIVLNYDHSSKHNFGLNWVFLSGQPATFPVGRMEAGNVVLPIYSDRNTERYPSYHRLDLSYNLKLRKWGKVQPDLSFSLYNAYGRHNTWSISFEPDEEDQSIMRAKNNYLFSFVPSVTLNLKF